MKTERLKKHIDSTLKLQLPSPYCVFHVSETKYANNSNYRKITIQFDYKEGEFYTQFINN